MSETVILITSSINPDSQSRANKDIINLGFSAFDVSASNNTASIKTNYDGNNIAVVLPIESYEDLPKLGRVYYTPLYTEKISYEEWAKTINKNFTELD